MEKSHPSGRGEFLKGAAATRAAVAIANAAVPTSTASAEENFPPVKLGIIGCGMMGTRHITRLLEMKQYYQITAVWDLYTKWLDTGGGHGRKGHDGPVYTTQMGTEVHFLSSPRFLP